MSKELMRKAAVGDILGKLIGLKKDKYWLFDQIRRLNPKIPVLPSMTEPEMLNACPDKLIFELKTGFESIAPSKQEISGLAETYHWFFTDLVASADPQVTVDDQALKIVELNKLIQGTATFRNRDMASTVILPTGDGNAVGFKDSQEKPLQLAIELHKAMNEYNEDKPPKKKIEVRVGLASGNVYHIKDLTGNPNVWGPGLIFARRVMDLGRAKSILAVHEFADGVQRLRPQYRALMHDAGTYWLKHELNPIRVYNIFGVVDGMDVGTKKDPAALPIPDNAIDEEFQKTNYFMFDSIEIALQVTDPATMMTHHTWVRQIVNLADKPVQDVYYFLDGDKPRDFSELNMKASDEKGRELQISRISKNLLTHKEFYVRLVTPLRPRQEGRFIKLEYDWEEIQREYFYQFASDCKKFKFLLIVPKGMPIRQQVARVNQNTGAKIASSIPAKTRYLDGGTEMEWEATDILAPDAYTFYW
jgi:class 3 adenylate cyclase